MPYVLKKSQKKYFSGTQRTCDPSETKARILESVKASGLPVYSKIKRIDKMDRLGLPVFAATHSDIFGNCGEPSWGKGLTEELAYVSALMERVERYSASDVHSSQDLIKKKFIDFNEGEAVSRWDFVPCNLQRRLYSKSEVDRQELHWTNCFALIGNKDVFVPANMVYFLPVEKFKDFSYTTGLASGNSIEEAILHALCEIIERHVEEVAYNNKIKFPTIPLESITNKELRHLIEIFLLKDFNLYLNRLDEDFNVAIIRAFAFEKRGPYANSFSQYASIGVHPNKEIAAIRALTEIAQTRACNFYRIKTKTQNIKMVEKIPDDMMRYFADIIDHERFISFGKIRSTDRDDIRVEIKNILKALNIKGCDVFFKDLTHPLLKIPVVRVIVKGLQPGNLGVGIIDYKHDVARISEHLDLYDTLINDIRDNNMTRLSI